MTLWSQKKLRRRDETVDEGDSATRFPSLVCVGPRPFPCVAVNVGQVSSGNVTKGQGWYLFLAQAEQRRQSFWAESHTET